MEQINSTKEWQELNNYRNKINLKELFNSDPNRAKDFAIRTQHLYYDFSRQLIDRKVFELLLKLADKAKLKEKISSMFAGEKINKTENRAVLHTALRSFSSTEVNEVLSKIEQFSCKVISGGHLGATGKKLKNIISIGIGGSYLGPEYLAQALRPYAIKGMNLRFIANVDGSDFAEKTIDLNPEETLFIVVSKTFTTAETMKNAETAKKWILKALNNHPESILKHFAAVSTAKEKATAFGIAPENIFGFWDWVGGRFSATSAVGAVPLSLYLGFECFKIILHGASFMDEHFKNTSFEKNIPVICGLIDIWNINFLGFKTRALLPYFQGLSKLPAHTQQVEMESNGKMVDIEGRPVGFDTGEVVFGEPGTNGQHSFYQLIHQGTQTIPCDFIGFIKSQYNLNEDGITHHEELMANFFAQPDALAFGHKNFPGNRPSSSLLLEELNPFTAGLLLSWTEHRAAVKGFIWGINSFDQFGVELGKVLGLKIREEIIKNHKNKDYKVSKESYPASHVALNSFFEKKLPS
ncbi:MAG: glucose-6-phosphate isomerase [Candidatus Saganbacteria bacterium]|uniref:Glucose-6-phosphate isomerase n=1 Tax=Candidatus Saganbacteria bacterium TaxID=2575572 RepID=A0A833L3X0_UNCSA|nr:MAG: glucose-6-phosphate isomerase [Candidatus Saganbacteria bacterium]